MTERLLAAFVAVDLEIARVGMNDALRLQIEVQGGNLNLA